MPIDEISTGIEELLRYYSIESLVSRIDRIYADWNDFNLYARSPASSNASNRRDLFDTRYQSLVQLHQSSTYSRAAIDDRAERVKPHTANISNVGGIRSNGLEQAQATFNSRPERGNFIPDSSLDSQILSYFLSAFQLRQTSYPKGENTSSRAVKSLLAIDTSILQDIEVGRTKFNVGIRDLATEIGSSFQISSSISDSSFEGSVSSERFPALQLRTSQPSISRPERRSSDKDPEFERVKKAIDMLEKLSSDKASKPERIWEGMKEFAGPGFIVETVLDSKDVYDVYNEKQRLDKTLPGGQYSSDRHQAGAAFAAHKIDPNDARTAGILNEFIGAYEISDLIDNEIGFANAGFPSYAYEILQYVKQNAELYARYADETKGNPFRHLGIELARKYPERYNLGSGFSPKPENRYNLGVSKSYESGEPATNARNAPSARGYNLGVRLPEVRSIDSSPYIDEGFQERRQPKQATPSSAEPPKSSGSGSGGENKDSNGSGVGSRGGTKDNSDGHYDRVGGPRTDNIA